SKNVIPDGLAFEQHCFNKLGYLTKVVDMLMTPRRKSTSSVYCRERCHAKNVILKLARVANTLEFVQHGLEKGLSLCSLQISSVSFLSNQFQLLGSSEKIWKVAQLSFQITRPPIKQVIPQRDLSLMLNALCCAPFKSLKEIHKFLLSIKAILLTA
uniref:Uncharacterized protein n=1 Tax=Latimeria chalumnae TaxID=7897 RepID=H3ASW7_LATCH